MKVNQLHKLHKQLGNKIIEFKDGKINGYEVTEYKDYVPAEVKFIRSIARPDVVLSFDGAYDLVFGNPVSAVTPKTCPDNHMVCTMFNNGMQGCVLYKVAK